MSTLRLQRRQARIIQVADQAVQKHQWQNDEAGLPGSWLSGLADGNGLHIEASADTGILEASRTLRSCPKLQSWIR